MKRMATILCLTVATSQCFAQESKIRVDITRPTGEFEVDGELGLKLGQMATVEGAVTEGSMKGYEGGPNLVVKTINGRATQHIIQIPVSPYFGKFGKANFGGKPLPTMENGFNYRLRVYETGEFVDVPSDAYDEAGIALQTTRFYFRNSLTVLSGDKIDAIVWNPIQFLDRDALLSGVAKNENNAATIQSQGWKLILTDVDKWTDEQSGKHAEVFGTVRATESKETFRVEDCRPRLTHLEDQLGKTVALRGTARSLNDHWWFNYRGTDLYVEGMDKLPNWAAGNHGRPIEITGVLEQAELPRIDQISLKSDRDLKTYFVVKRAHWTPVKELLTPELPPGE